MGEGYKGRKIVAGEVSQVMVRLERNLNAMLKGLVLTPQMWRAMEKNDSRCMDCTVSLSSPYVEALPLPSVQLYLEIRPLGR